MAGDARPHWSSYLSIVFSAIALLVSGYTAYRNLWPSDETKASVTHVEWSVSSGSYGRGPQLVLGLGFVNRGNSPIIVSKLTASFGLAEAGGPASSCDISDDTRWIGIPWVERVEGGNNTRAIAISIPPNIATPLIYVFDSGQVTPSLNKGEEQRVFACISVGTIDSDGNSTKVRHPLGLILFDDQRIVDFVRADEMETPFLVVH